MDDFTEMFDEGMSVEERMEKAAYILKEAAEDEGIDIEDLDPEQLEGMVNHIVHGPSEEQGDEGGGEEQEAAEGGEEGKTASDVTHADVTLEIIKRAAAEDIDLSQLDDDTFHEIYEKVAEELTNPEIQEENQKWAAEVAKMDELGRVAARGFVDEINKQAADEDDEDDDEKKEKKEEAKKEAALKDKAKAVLGSVGRGLTRGKNHATKAERSAHAFIGNKMPGGGKGLRTERDAVSRGRKATGGAAGAAAVAGGGAYAHKKSKEKKASYVEEAALNLARQTLLDNGIDPDTGTKIASDDEVSARAYEILQEAGYSV